MVIMSNDGYTETKKCPVCKGKKRKKVYSEYGENGFLPGFTDCDECDASGFVCMTPDEIHFEHQLKKDEEHER